MERKHRYNWKSTIINYFRKAAELYEQKAFAIDTELLSFKSKINADERRHYIAESLKLKTLSADYETIATRMTQSGESIYRTGYGIQKWNFQNKFNPDYAKNYNWQKTQSLKTKFQRLIDTHDFYFLTVCIKQINEKELTEKTNKLKSLWQPLKYELQKQFDGAYGVIEFDYGYTTENGKNITTYQPHIHYWLTIKKNTKINVEALERKITEILEKHFKGSAKGGVEIHQHFNAVEKAGYVHKWRFIGSDYGNECDTPKNENEMIRNTFILIALYKASKGLRPFYYGTLSNRRTGSRIYNNKIKEKNSDTEKENKTTYTTENEKTTKDTDGVQITCYNANRTLLTALLTAILLTRRFKIGMPRNGYHRGEIQKQTTKHKPP